ncbi:flagellar biosynthetic protein FliO [Psychrobium sp. MM17-31]|uniref:flagellar biosynthetic protein FliO n=1 Tax=Psychrobium sp. MM17-31 TaxID=2917758 RepID=UPI001EF4D93F|nr:flagellar biosynthetic protein FliO [Psychrobium sp. MM17-31]MCG7530083.1 flagellar biosynthetic protein FliO [Psychrobium sp. MM17-31]
MATFAVAVSLPAAASVSAQPPDFLRMIISLVIVLAVIFVLAFVVKKLKITPHSQKNLRSIAHLSIGPKERVVVVEVNGEQLLLGVTSQSVNLLHKLEKPIEKTDTSSGMSNDNMPLTIQSLLKKGKS